MNKMVSSSAVLTAAVLIFVFTGQALAFCVHNKSDKPMDFSQTSGNKTFRGFSATLNPGQDSCCHWSNKDCNKDGGKSDTVGFSVMYSDAFLCKNVKIPACSDLDVTGSNGNYRCIPHGMETCN